MLPKMQEKVNQRICEFKKDLNDLSPIEMVRKYITSGDCFILSNDQYFDLRSKVACCFGLHPNEVLVVGSAKLGFSIAPCQLYNTFSTESDIDVALVSSKLFDEIWQSGYDYKYSGEDWKKKEHSKFIKYLFRGWIWIDMLPESPLIPLIDKGVKLFEKMTSSGMFGNHKISGGLYKSYFFLENYQKICIEHCIKDKIESEAQNADNSD